MTPKKKAPESVPPKRKTSPNYTGTGLIEQAQDWNVDQEKLDKPPKDVPRMLA